MLIGQKHKKRSLKMLNQLNSKSLLFLRLVTAVIFFQTLFFKFTGAPESKFIFSTLGIEPWGRYFAGVSELIASILLVFSATQVFGAGMALAIGLGALSSHIFVLGITVQNDNGLLFGLALLVTIFSATILAIKIETVKHSINSLKKAILKTSK